ncbi:protein-tyrosine kinase 6-like protein [Lates japonicus]|uniref:Protein-tyrosine kinase 6-like protein n=1 Tax=Lates japonicus TaxID=270547 RepID=A0AAD3R0K2_LATJO|nr:protein-tyrosine kinase 6-like protein [Lates japonicus]
MGMLGRDLFSVISHQQRLVDRADDRQNRRVLNTGIVPNNYLARAGVPENATVWELEEDFTLELGSGCSLASTRGRWKNHINVAIKIIKVFLHLC